MSSSLLISLATTVITAVFALMVFARYLTKRRWYLLAWSVGLALFSLGTAAQVVLFDQFSELWFKLWYWAGALVVAPWLGQGTVFLLVRKGNRAWISFWFVAGMSALSLAVILGAGVAPNAYQPGVDLSAQFGDIFTATGAEKTVRTVLAIVLNTYGTVLLVGGAVYSAYLFWRKRVLLHRVVGNVFIAAGGCCPPWAARLSCLGTRTSNTWGSWRAASSCSPAS
ncbi:MAG: hypothetical protein M5R40_17745 [Anaerolineae bacterium]|nr:hypothetical protein [Anaerolineae bacterium]